MLFRSERWHTGNIVLIGDAAHTAHFSIGSGTKLAMEDAISLIKALEANDATDIPAALAAYEDEHRVDTLKLQKAAQTSLEWFENVDRHVQLFHLTLDIAGDSGVADVGIDLAASGDTDRHWLQAGFEVNRVGGNDHRPCGNCLTNLFDLQLLSLGHEFHLRGNLTPTGG